MTIRRLCCLLLLVTLLSACSGPLQSPHTLGEMSRDGFVDLLRWKRYQEAASLMRHEADRDQFLQKFRELKEIHMTDVQVVELNVFDEGLRFEATIDIEYYLLPSVTLKTFTFTQGWAYFEEDDFAPEGFYIVSPFPEFP